jgi:hypothetical protein
LTTGVGSVSAERDHKCVVTTGGGVKCWGDNSKGQLGNGTTSNSLIPVDASGLTSGVTAVAVKAETSCAIVSGGVKCWGNGQLTPTDVTGLGSGVTALSVGYGNYGMYCALVSGGAKCSSDYYSISLTSIGGLESGAATISTDDFASCAVTSTGAAKCWNTDSSGIGIPSDIAGLAGGVVDVRVAPATACALLDTGGVRCWGDNIYGNQFGQLGNGTTEPSVSPVDVVGLSDASAIAVDYQNSCAVTTAHVLKCWGEDYGTAPVVVPGP